jgi:hypothetical protein
MKFKLDKTVPSALRYGNTHLIIEFDQGEYDQANQLMNSWEEQELAKIPAETLAILQDHTQPKKFGGGSGGGGGYKKTTETVPPKPGEYHNLVKRAAQICGLPCDQTFVSMLWGYVGAYEKDGKWKGPFAKSYDEGAGDAASKGWDWWAGKQVEKLASVVKALESGDAVPIRYAAGNMGKERNWETIWKGYTLTPLVGGAPPEATGMVQPSPDIPDWLSDNPKSAAAPLPNNPAFDGPDPGPPAGYGDGSAWG